MRKYVPWLESDVLSEQSQETYVDELGVSIQEHILNDALQPMFHRFNQRMAIVHIFTSNKLEGTLARGTSEGETYELLGHLWDTEKEYEDETIWLADGERRFMKTQMSHHVRALKHLLRLESIQSEDLVTIHGMLMKNAKGEKTLIRAGKFREGAVHADHHVYPDHTCIRPSLHKILEIFRQQSTATLPFHQAVELSIRLFYDLITLHPFDDGNGRMCRMVLAFALIKTGVAPFPLSLSSGHSKSRKHYISAILSVRGKQDWFPMRALVLVSLHRAWQNLSTNAKFESMA